MKYLPILIFFGSFLYYSSGTRAPMFFYDEERNSGCAREMAERADFVVPTFNYQLRSDKPVLHYYFMMFSYSIFGVNEFASRFFSVFFGALTILITFLFIRKYLNVKIAVYSILIMLASLNFSLEFHLAVPDPYLIFFLTLSHFTFYDFFKSGKLSSLFLMYLSIGAAILAKGPVALGLFGLNAILFLIIKKEFKWQSIRNFRLLTGSVIVMLIVLPWFIKVGLATDWQWQKEFFLEQNLGRLAGKMEGHGGFFGLIILYVFLAFIPFAFFLVQSFRYALKNYKENDLILFSLIISFVIVLFFTISATKLPNYPMPAYPFIAFIAAYFFASAKIPLLKTLLIFTLLISVLIPVMAYAATQIIPEISFLSYHCLIFIILPLGAISALWYWIKEKNQEKVLLILSSSWVITSLIVFIWIFPVLSKQDPVQQVLPQLNATRPIAFYRRFNSAFPFYLKKPLQKLITPDQVKDFFLKNPDGYLISVKKYEAELNALPLKQIFEKKDLFESPVTTVYIIQK
jgi:4-amino-4-deoxy-L-arabinose transferase-like glycosyltransferase